MAFLSALPISPAPRQPGLLDRILGGLGLDNSADATLLQSVPANHELWRRIDATATAVIDWFNRTGRPPAGLAAADYARAAIMRAEVNRYMAWMNGTFAPAVEPLIKRWAAANGRGLGAWQAIAAFFTLLAGIACAAYVSANLASARKAELRTYNLQAETQSKVMDSILRQSPDINAAVALMLKAAPIVRPDPPRTAPTIGEGIQSAGVGIGVMLAAVAALYLFAKKGR